MDVLDKLPHTGESTRSVLVADGPEPAPGPMAPGGRRPVDGEFDADLRSDEFLVEAQNNGRIMRMVAGAAAVVALLVIAIALFPSPGAGTNIVAEVSAADRALQLTAATTTSSTAAPAPAPSRPAEEPIGFLVEPMDQLSLQLAPLLSDTGDGEWTEPELEPESAWIDGGNGVRLPDVLLRIRFCESTNNYGAAHRSSSARGAYQFLTMSWEWYGHAERYGVAMANLATPAQQDQAALLTFEQDGARPWAESRPCWDNPDIDPRYLTARPSPTTTSPPQATTTTAPSSTTTTAPGSSTTTTEGGTSTTTTTAPTTTTTAPTSTTPSS